MRIENRAQCGLSLVELMVSVAISAAVLSSLVYVYVGSRGAYRNNEALARVQETGRFALEWVSRDLRQAGFMGCLSRGASITYQSNPVPKILPNVDQPPVIGVFGYENGEGFVNPSETIARIRGDVLIVASLDGRTATPITADTSGDTISISDNCAQFGNNDIVVVSDCSRAVAVTLTRRPTIGCNPGGAAIVLTHAATNAAGESKNLATPIDPPFRASERAFVARLTTGGAGTPTTGYFIGNNRAGRPSLYRFVGASTAEEVVENVEDLDVLYGVDTSGDGAVDVYQTAADVTAANQWPNVLSVRISVIVASAEAVDRPGGETQTLYFRDTNGDTVVDAQAAPSDRRLRQVFTTTVALRNRLD